MEASQTLLGKPLGILKPNLVTSGVPYFPRGSQDPGWVQLWVTVQVQPKLKCCCRPQRVARPQGQQWSRGLRSAVFVQPPVQRSSFCFLFRFNASSHHQFSSKFYLFFMLSYDPLHELILDNTVARVIFYSRIIYFLVFPHDIC